MPLTNDRYAFPTPSHMFSTRITVTAPTPRTVMEITFPVPLAKQTLADGSCITGVLLWEDGHYEFTSDTTNVGGG